MVQIGSLQYAKRCTLVSSLIVALFSVSIKVNSKVHNGTDFSNDQTKLREQNNENKSNVKRVLNFKVDDWISFDLKYEVGDIIRNTIV